MRPVAGRIEDTYYEAGEVASAGAAGAPAPPGRQAQGDLLRAGGGAARARAWAATCRSPATDARRSHRRRSTSSGSEAEYTPPVIFSRENRGKLMFRAEARLSGDGASLPLGQPVDVARRRCEARNERRSDRHRRPRPDQALRRQDRGQGCRPEGLGRRDRRLPRPERLRQDDDDPHDLRSASPDGRRGHLPRPRHRRARPRRSSARSAT